MKKKMLSIVLTILLSISFVPTVTTKAATIAEDAKEFNGNYYYAIKRSIKWEDAKENCESSGGHLVTITSLEEQEFVNSIVTDTDAWYAIGTVYDISNQKISFITGESSSYTNWYSAVYPKSGKTNKYVGLNPSKGWGNGYNYNWSGYICEWESDDINDSPPAKVVLSSVKKASSSSATVSWEEIKGAEGYCVYMRVGASGKYKKISTINEYDIATYTKTKLSRGTYYFKVRAFKTIDNERAYGEYSATKKITLK